MKGTVSKLFIEEDAVEPRSMLSKSPEEFGPIRELIRDLLSTEPESWKRFCRLTPVLISDDAIKI